MQAENYGISLSTFAQRETLAFFATVRPCIIMPLCNHRYLHTVPGTPSIQTLELPQHVQAHEPGVTLLASRGDYTQCANP
jgi:hypothetical protein